MSDGCHWFALYVFSVQNAACREHIAPEGAIERSPGRFLP